MKCKALLVIALLAALLAGSLSACAEADDDAPMPAGYVLVTTATQAGWLPLPTEGEQSLPLTQTLPDGTRAVNLIHLTPNSVYMEDSTCANHDCVGEGEVTLDNISERILGNMIICLPNQVVLYLYSSEEVLAMLGALPGPEEEAVQPEAGQPEAEGGE